MSADVALVGRDEELEVLDAALAALRAGQSGSVAVVGEAGIGKTRLLDELVARARGRDHRVLRGRAAEFEQQVPFALAVDLLDAHLAAMNGDRLNVLGEERLAELAAVFPSV